MLRRLLTAAIAVTLVVPVAAEATSSPKLEDGRRSRVPSAQVQATGSGAITITGRMVVNGTIPERGVVTIIDRRRDATAYLAGEKLRFRRGKVTVRRASGILFVTGSNVQVQVVGASLTFAAAGNGRGRFFGTGTYRLNGGEERAWSSSWVKIAPSSKKTRKRERRDTAPAAARRR